LQLDVTNYEAVETLANDFRRRGITIDILVNNAAAFLDKSHNVLNVPFSMIKETLEINALAPFACARVFMEGMLTRKYGRIVNVSSEMGQFENLDGWGAAYRVSKTALNAFTVMLAEAGREHNVLVNSVCPGWVQNEKILINTNLAVKIRFK
jgi:NAD(P)-dependent dehydrogenase (short-subunit alcohol dehydrogenase family)